MQDLNKPEFVTKLISGDGEAFQILFDRLAPILRDFIVKSYNIEICDAEEIASDGLVKVHRSITKFNPQQGVKLTTWIFRIARNTALDYLKKPAPPIKVVPIDENLSLSQETVKPNKEEAAQDEDKNTPLQRMQRALASLKEQDRTILILRQSMEYEEIAAAEGANINAIRTRYSRAFDRLKIAFNQENNDDEQ